MSNKSAKLSCSMTPLSNDDFNVVFFPTLALIAFTLVLEALSHESLICCTTISDLDDANNTDPGTMSHATSLTTIVVEQPRPQASPEAEASSSMSEQIQSSAPGKAPVPMQTCCLPNVSPNIRANRLITAIFLYAGVLTFFIIRMRDISVPHLRPECAGYISIDEASSRMPKTNWWVAVLLNILPFVCASFGLLRTVVDCVLVRWGQGLGYGGERAGNTWMWPLCMPLIALWLIPYMTIKVLLVFPIACIMGRPLSSTWSHALPKKEMGRKNDIEMQSEETRRLVDDMDGAEEAEQANERSEDPPAYDEALHERETGVKEMQQWLHRN